MPRLRYDAGVPACKLYRQIAVADLPDDDWVDAQAVLAGVRDVYSLWPGRAGIEIMPVWWDDTVVNDAGGVPVYDSGNIGIVPVEYKVVAADSAVAGVPRFAVYINAAPTLAWPAFEKKTLNDTSADAIYLRVTAATAPSGATHLRLLAEVTQ